MKKMVVEVRTAHCAVTTALSPTSVNTMSRAHAPPRHAHAAQVNMQKSRTLEEAQAEAREKVHS